jgi:hypothetical protein
MKEDGIKNVVSGLEEKNMANFYSYLNKAILLMVHCKLVLRKPIAITMQAYSTKL